MNTKPHWWRALSSEERSELERLDREIKLQEAKNDTSIGGQRKLIFLKYQRKVIQNRSTIRSKRATASA